MPDKLAKGWVKTTYREVTRHHSGAGSMIKGKLHDSPGDGRIPTYSASGQDVWADVSTGEGDAIIVSAVGARCGKAFLASGKWAAIANTHVVWPETIGVNATFLWYLLNDEHFWERGGTAQPFVLIRKSLERGFDMPPLAEQERIVAKLEAFLSRVDAGEAAARRALERLKRYRAAVLHAAVTGELTCDWRKTHKPDETGAQLLKRLLQARRARWEAAEFKRLQAAGKPPKDDKWKSRYPEPAIPDAANGFDSLHGWELASFDQCFEVGRGKFSIRPRNDPAYYNGTHPFVQIGNLPREGGLITEYSQTLNDKGLSVSRKFSKGTILIAIVGATMANTGVLGFDACCPDSLVAVQTDDETLRGYADIWLRANKFKLRALAVASGGQPNINLGILLPFAIALPPLAEQAEIIRSVEHRLVAVERLTATLHRQLERASCLRHSLLHEAFIGDLVAQNPNDEPASVLLERIRAARKDKAEKPKPKRMPKPKRHSGEVKRRNLLEVLKENGAAMRPEDLFTRSGYGEPIEPAEVADPAKAVEAFYAEVSRLTRASLLVEKAGHQKRASPQPFRPHSSPPDLWQSPPPPWAPGQPRAQGGREAFSGPRAPPSWGLCPGSAAAIFDPKPRRKPSAPCRSTPPPNPKEPSP